MKVSELRLLLEGREDDEDIHFQLEVEAFQGSFEMVLEDMVDYVAVTSDDLDKRVDELAKRTEVNKTRLEAALLILERSAGVFPRDVDLVAGHVEPERLLERVKR